MRKRGEWPSAERSDTRGCGSRIAPTGASEARSRYSGDAASRREWRAKDAGASPCGTGYPPNEVSRRRRSLEGCEAEGTLNATNSTRGAMRGHGRGRQPSEPKQGEASCAGLRPEGIYVYVERSQGRTNRPLCTGSTVAPTVTARWKASQHQARSQANQHTANAHRTVAKFFAPSCGDGVPDGIITTTQRSNA